MNAARFQQVTAVFNEVADLPAEAREAAILRRCGDDQELATEVRALLTHDAAPSAEGEATDPHLGLRLGQYAVTALIARGGMAAVYEAQRADDQFQQRVAIKVMDLRLSDPAIVSRFAAERQILATLEHPSLTRLLDGGMTTLGEPYLVMEFVDGVPIDRFCDERRLDLDARLRLFAQVCEGVSFAHRTLVLHRDLKPSNILVSRDGHVKVVDFGTATLLQPDRLMTTSRAPLTPAYASPEQLMGGAVGTASDQYSLGLVLFELLTGAPAFGERTSLMAAVERALARTTTAAPHAVVTEAAAQARQTSLAKLRRTLSGDLATIVGKALAPDAAARYASVQHLADDLTRWTAGEPILGRAPSLVYRTTRFVQRHVVASALVALLLLGLAATTVVSLRQAALARAQAAIARDQAAIATTESSKARQLNRFLTGMLSSANPSWYNPSGNSASSITVRQVLDGASSKIAADLGGSPAVEAEMRRTLGRTYIALGDAASAKQQLDRALELHAAQHDAFGVAFTQELLGEHGLLTGDYVSAEKRLREALAYVRSPGETPADPELHMIVANDLAVAISNRLPGNAEAIALQQEAIAVGDRNGLGGSGAAVGVSNLALNLLSAGRLDEAEQTTRDALRRMDLLTPPPPERFGTMNNLSVMLRIKGQAAEAERLAAAAVAGGGQVFEPAHFRHAAFGATWGRALTAVGDLGRADKVLTTAYRTWRKSRPADHPDVVNTLTGLGVVQRLQGRLGPSERTLREAHAIAIRYPALRERGADVAGELGLTLRARGQTDEADRLLRQSYDTLLEIFGASHPLTQKAKARVDGATR